MSETGSSAKATPRALAGKIKLSSYLPPETRPPPQNALHGLTSSARKAGATPPALWKAHGKLSRPAPSADFRRMKTAPSEDRLGRAAVGTGFSERPLSPGVCPSMARSSRGAERGGGPGTVFPVHGTLLQLGCISPRSSQSQDARPNHPSLCTPLPEHLLPPFQSVMQPPAPQLPVRTPFPSTNAAPATSNLVYGHSCPPTPFLFQIPNSFLPMAVLTHPPASGPTSTAKGLQPLVLTTKSNLQGDRQSWAIRGRGLGLNSEDPEGCEEGSSSTGVGKCVMNYGSPREHVLGSRPRT